MTVKELFKRMRSITYGWWDEARHKPVTQGDQYFDDEVYFFQHCRILQPREVWRHLIGTCWDQTLLELDELPRCTGVDLIKTFWWCYITPERNPDRTHMGVYFRVSQCWFYFEHSWYTKRGIYGPWATIQDCRKRIQQYALEDKPKEMELWFEPELDTTPLLNNYHLTPKEMYQAGFQNYTGRINLHLQ